MTKIMTASDAAKILEEAMALVDEGYSTHEDEVGSLRWPGRPEKRVDPLVWLAVRAMVVGLGIAAERQLNNS